MGAGRRARDRLGVEKLGALVPPERTIERILQPSGMIGRNRLRRRRSLEMPAEVVYEYVTAVLDLATRPAEGNLRVHRDGEFVATRGHRHRGRR